MRQCSYVFACVIVVRNARVLTDMPTTVDSRTEIHETRTHAQHTRTHAHAHTLSHTHTHAHTHTLFTHVLCTRAPRYMVWAATTHKYTFDYREGDVYWCTADIGWVTGHSYIAYGPLLNGATRYIYICVCVCASVCVCVCVVRVCLCVLELQSV